MNPRFRPEPTTAPGWRPRRLSRCLRFVQTSARMEKTVQGRPSGIAVVDVGATNSKVALFDAALSLVAERKIPSRHVPPPPYAYIDPQPLTAFLAEALPELDTILS